MNFSQLELQQEYKGGNEGCWFAIDVLTAQFNAEMKRLLLWIFVDSNVQVWDM